jgi:hypothetical protein
LKIFNSKFVSAQHPQTYMPNQRSRCKQQGIKLAALQSSGVFGPRGSLLAGIKQIKSALCNKAAQKWG